MPGGTDDHRKKNNRAEAQRNWTETASLLMTLILGPTTAWRKTRSVAGCWVMNLSSLSTVLFSI
jgi:hypothetical protein